MIEIAKISLSAVYKMNTGQKSPVQYMYLATSTRKTYFDNGKAFT